MSYLPSFNACCSIDFIVGKQKSEFKPMKTRNRAYVSAEYPEKSFFLSLLFAHCCCSTQSFFYLLFLVCFYFKVSNRALPRYPF